MIAPDETYALKLPDVVDVSALPTTDPHVVGQLYVDSNTVKVSAG